MEEKTKAQFAVSIPVNASGLEGFDTSVPFKAIAKDSNGRWHSQILTLDKNGKGEIKMTFDENPGSIKIKLGPDKSSEQEIDQMDTVELAVSARQFQKGTVLRKQEIDIRPDIAHIIWFPCKYFKITGRLLCTNGRPVPGATVHASDVDYFWWWRSFQQVGSSVTDINGYFEISFRWCCHWQPWIWWGYRQCCLDPDLFKKLKPILAKKVVPTPIPEPDPDFSIFESLLEESFQDIQLPKTQSLSLQKSLFFQQSISANLTLKEKNSFDPSVLINLGDKLRIKLLDSDYHAELISQKVWPFCRFYPWRDCTPDIIFRVTQHDGIQENVILDESYFDTRWDIPTNLNVTLYANEKANCLPSHDSIPGNCINLQSVCLLPLHTIGGNTGFTGLNLPGYNNSGGKYPYCDQPFGGTMSIVGEFGDATDADYYELEWNSSSPSPSANWKPVPRHAISGFSRSYYGPDIMNPNSKSEMRVVPFDIETINGKYVIKTRHYYEKLNNFQEGTLRWWMDPVETLIFWLTPRSFTNGTYYLRFKTYKKEGNGIYPLPILNQCGTNENNYICVTTDNTDEGSGPIDTYGHNCGAGSIHKCTDEPEAYILAVKLLDNCGNPKKDKSEKEINLTPCSDITISKDDLIEIDFIAHDHKGHLLRYDFGVTGGLNLSKIMFQCVSPIDSSPTIPYSEPLLKPNQCILQPLTSSPVPGIPTADFIGPNYQQAVNQGAKRPTWQGGALRLIFRATDIFSLPCSYELRLYAWKRTIVDCVNDLSHQYNASLYTFSIRYGNPVIAQGTLNTQLAETIIQNNKQPVSLEANEVKMS